MKKIPNILMRLALLFQFLHSFILFLLPTPAKPSQQNQNQIKKHERSPQLEKPSDLRKLFDAFDAYKDGLITSDELSTSLRKLGIPISDSDLANLIKTVDSNNDGCVDADEFEALYAMLTSEEKEEELKDAFGVFDKDGDGFISEEELKGVLDALGICHGRSLEECRRMIQKVDVDGDGRVSFSEFQVMMKDAAAFVDI